MQAWPTSTVRAVSAGRAPSSTPITGRWWPYTCEAYEAVGWWDTRRQGAHAGGVYMWKQLCGHLMMGAGTRILRSSIVRPWR